MIDVVVIGGGLAGLTCAVGLKDAGLGVRVLERSATLGGRARSWVDETTGDPVHIGPHIFLNHYPNMFRLLDMCGTRDRVIWEKNRRFVTMVDGETEVPIQSSPLPPPYHYVPSLLADPETSLADLVSNWPIVELAARLDEGAVQRFDAIAASELLRAVGVTERFIERFWAFTAMAIMNVPLERCSAGALLRFYQHLVGHADLEVGFPDGGLGDLYAPGCQRLLEDAGHVVSTGARVVRIEGDARAASAVVLASGERIEARFVVAALPPEALGSLEIPAWSALPPFRDLAAFEAVPYVSVFLWFDRKLTEQQFWARVYRPEDLNCDFYDLSNIHRGWRRRPSLVTSNIIYSHRVGAMTDDEIAARTIAELAEYLPEAKRARVVHRVVNRIPMAIHAPSPGTESLRPETRTPVANLFVAGDWVRTGFPSSMESAARSGWMAAEAILADVGRPARLRVERAPSAGMIPWLGRNARFVPFRRSPAWVEELLRASDAGAGPAR